jgi:osmotically-inducible protein OsmY
VPSEKQKTRAAATVRNVAGVVEVRNLLEVAGPVAEARPRRSDAALRRDIERSLKADRSLRYSRITVQSVNQGVVLLSGNAFSSRDEARAIRAATVRPGVRRVVSRVRVLNAIAVPPASTPIDLSSPVTSTTMDAEDDEIRRAVEEALLDLDARENANIRVSVKDGVVWLTGSVPTWQGNNDRLHATRSVPGVRSIVNELQVAQ